MDQHLFNVVLVRIMIEHRLTGPNTTMAQAINEVAQVTGFSPRYVNMILIGDKRNGKALEAIEDAVTQLSDARGGVPDMCCGTEGLAIIERSMTHG